MYQLITRAARMIERKNFALSIFYCPLCGGQRPFVRLNNNELSVRCIHCRATPITLSLVAVLRRIFPELHAKKIYELSSRGPLVHYLKRASQSLNCSEYFSHTAPGHYSDGVQCQDVQKLTFADESFDLCTSTEVFEHVPNDAKGFAQIQRVLKPAGVFIFTVPLEIQHKTVERVKLTPQQELAYLLEPQYHSDPIRDHEQILVFRNYGYDILDRLIAAGFSRAELHHPGSNMAWDYTRPVVVAYREAATSQWLDSEQSLIQFKQS